MDGVEHANSKSRRNQSNKGIFLSFFFFGIVSSAWVGPLIPPSGDEPPIPSVSSEHERSILIVDDARLAT